MVTFGETLNLAKKAFDDVPNLANRIDVVTLIRDVTGRISIIAEPKAGAEMLENDPDLANYANALSARLGPYYARQLWTTDRVTPAFRALYSAAKKDRVVADFDKSSSSPKWFKVERHVAKHLWATKREIKPPWPNEAVDKGGRAPIVTFFSFKGGLGRTTTLAGTAISLARAGHRVAIVDLDLEAPGLHSLFSSRVPEAGVVDYLLEKRVQPDQWTLRTTIEIINDRLVVGETGQDIRVVPAGAIEPGYLEKLARLDFQHLKDDDLSETFRQMLRELDRTAGPVDFILLDARAGFHELGGFAVSGLSHGVVLVGSQSRQNWAGLTEAVRLTARPFETDPLPVALVHAQVPGILAGNRATVLKEFAETAYDVFLQNYYDEEDSIPNANDSEAPFNPLTIDWLEQLRGDLRVFKKDDSAEEKERLAQLCKLLTEACRPVAERLCRMFGRSPKKEAAQ
jgi:MinD-like ATPase involved in chromosome partitioning or flagellar assembly